MHAHGVVVHIETAGNGPGLQRALSILLAALPLAASAVGNLENPQNGGRESGILHERSSAHTIVFDGVRLRFGR